MDLATVVKDSMSPGSIRLTTLLINCPSYLLIDLLPIRELSITRRQTEPNARAFVHVTAMAGVCPASFGAEHIFAEKAHATRWTTIRHTSVQTARLMAETPDPASREVIERVVFPYSMVQLVVTSTQWRTALDQLWNAKSKDVHKLATMIGDAIHRSTPHKLAVNEWHLPFIDSDDSDAAIWHVVNDNGIRVLLTDIMPSLCLELLTRVSVSRVKNVRNCTGEDKIERIKNDLLLFSPEEGSIDSYWRDAYDHQATPDEATEKNWRNAHLHGNLTGWCQYRQLAQWEEWKQRRVKGVQTSA